MKIVKPPVDKNGLTRKERQAKIRQIVREHDRALAEMGSRPHLPAGSPAFIIMVVAVMAVIGGAVIQAAGKGGGGKALDDRQTGMAKRSLAAVAEALGRFKYHCGVYPSVEEGGIAALAEKSGRHPGWMGPYIRGSLNPARWREVAIDPWKRPYVYEPPAEGDTNGVPVLLSIGKDGIRGTDDDIYPDPALFKKASEDTAWANDWVPFPKRGYIVVSKEEKERELREKAAQKEASEQ